MPHVELKQGDCLSTIALSRGFDPETVWDHGDNAALRERRTDPNTLLPGDRLFVPELEQKQEPAPTDTLTTFRLSVGPIRLRVRLTRRGEPRPAEPYVLELDDGVTLEGETDDDGWVDQPISITAKTGTLSLRDGEEQHELKLGHLDPHDEPTGVQSRLRGLGFYFGAIDGEIGPKTKAALRRFQAAKALDPSGAADDATTTALRDSYGS
ncbi:peptidoglycan-binding domain-containing protein [Enhygromyxa salina]|uniref:Putative peptidoglycan binding domain protein n=1 Tax=Enhygromyxa salina TaxID=215803 RepID=A0A2S9Y2S0_9BACT|nr:peptidoglycan-binding domain-containing protein [Enhygromyxa salina]PRP99331.1 putative peptidoglycan binding domain protein [Enhygromyxa salina]